VKNATPYLKITKAKQGWGHGSRGRIPEFKPQYWNKKKNEERKGRKRRWEAERRGEQ
jgi:hypothetical protein